MNFYTQNDQCPVGFQKKLLHSIIQSENTYKPDCNRCGFLLLNSCCRDKVTGMGRRNVVLYGCVAITQRILSSSETSDLKIDVLYAYGGSFTTKKVNPVTGAASCPQNQGFTAVSVTTEMRVCLAERATATHNLPSFGGIYSCLSNSTCPAGYSAFTMDVLGGECFLYACLKFVNLAERRSLYPITLPPFVLIPVRNETSDRPLYSDTNSSTSTSSGGASLFTSNDKRVIAGFSVSALVLSLLTITVITGVRGG